MRVLMVVDSLGLGGKERQVLELVKGLTGRGVELRVVCLEHGDFYGGGGGDRGARVEYVPRTRPWDFLVFRDLRRVIRDFQPDVVHTNGLVSSFYAVPLSKWYGLPVINGSIRNAFRKQDWRWRLERALLACSTVRVANSLAGLQSRGFSVDSGRDFVVRNGLDLSRFHDVAVGTSGASERVVGMVAEFNRYKDYDTFVSAALIVLAERRDVTFVAVGDGETLDAAKRRVPIGCRGVRFLGRRRDVERVVSGFTVGVLATFSEGLSNSIMEYMALGKPVVATDGGGSCELVVHGKTGFLVPPRDPAALARRVLQLVDDPVLALSMGRAGRLRIESEFSLATMTDTVIELYESVIAQPRGDTGRWSM